MKVGRKLMSALLTAALILSLLALSACNGGGQADDPSAEPDPTETVSPYEFEFTGSTVIADQTYNVTIYGSKDETFSLRIAEMPVAELVGTWTFVENKGYKLYFDDTNASFVYTKYDPDTKQFSFNYTLDLGDTNGGAGKVAFTAVDEAFASEYDGEGLGALPPTFTGYTTWMGAMAALGEPVKCTLTCFEDGTCTSISSNEVKFASPRNGTWSYDEATNTYTFEMEPELFEGATIWHFTQPICTPLEDAAANWTLFEGECYWSQDEIAEPYTNNTFTTEYDEATGTYYLILEHGFSGANEYAERYLAYTPEA